MHTSEQQFKRKMPPPKTMKHNSKREKLEMRSASLGRVGTFSWTKLAYPKERGEKSHLSGKEGSVLHDYRQNRQG